MSTMQRGFRRKIPWLWNLLLVLVVFTSVFLAFRPTNYYINKAENCRPSAGDSVTPVLPSTTLAAQDLVKDEPVHIIYGVSGEMDSFFAELEQSLKSVLMNAPLHSNLFIHFMADEKAYYRLEKLFRNTGLYRWRFRNQITIRAYNVQPKIPRWERDHIQPILKSAYRHTIGSFFRLFAFDVLPSDVENAVYMDSDVLIVTPLDELWRHRDPTKWFQWGLEQQTAGFILFNVPKCKGIWDILPKYDLMEYASKRKYRPGDQIMLRLVNHTNPELVGPLPNEWDNSRAAFWGKLEQHRQNGVGQMHFNGGGSGSHSALSAKGEGYLSTDKFMKGWGTGRYFTEMTWEWAKYLTESHLPPGNPGRLIHFDYNFTVPL